MPFSHLRFPSCSPVTFFGDHLYQFSAGMTIGQFTENLLCSSSIHSPDSTNPAICLVNWLTGPCPTHLMNCLASRSVSHPLDKILSEWALYWIDRLAYRLGRCARKSQYSNHTLLFDRDWPCAASFSSGPTDTQKKERAVPVPVPHF